MTSLSDLIDTNISRKITDILYESVHMYLFDALETGRAMQERHQREADKAFKTDPDRKLHLQDNLRARWNRQELFVRAEAYLTIEPEWHWLDGRHLRTFCRDLDAYLPEMSGIYLKLRTRIVKELETTTADMTLRQVSDTAATLRKSFPVDLKTARLQTRQGRLDTTIPWIDTVTKLKPADMEVSLQQAQLAFQTVQATKPPSDPDYQVVQQRLADIIEAGQALGVQPSTSIIPPRDIGIDGWFTSPLTSQPELDSIRAAAIAGQQQGLSPARMGQPVPQPTIQPSPAIQTTQLIQPGLAF